MKYEVIIENSAERDLLEILTYISETLLEPARPSGFICP